MSRRSWVQFLVWSLFCTLTKEPEARFNVYDDLFNIRKQDDKTLVHLGVRIEKAMQTIQNLRLANFTIPKLDAELQCMALIRSLPKVVPTLVHIAVAEGRVG